MLRRSTSSVLGCAFVFAVASGLSAQQTDTIRLTTGEAKTGKVLRLSYKAVTYAPAGAERGVEVDEARDTVADITFYDGYVLQRGEDALKSGNTAAAIQSFRRAAEEADQSRVRPFLKQFGLFGVGKAHQQSGEWAKAAEAYLALNADVPDTWFKMELYDRAIDCAMRQDNALLEEVLRRMRGETGEAGKRLQLKAESTRAWVLLKTQKFAEARPVFERLAIEQDPAIKSRARLGLLRCLDGEKKSPDLKRACEEAVRDAGAGPALLGAAWAYLGEQQLTAAKDPAQVKEALFSFLRTVTLYQPERGEPGEDYAKALYFAGECFDRLKEVQKDPDAKQLYANRAQALHAELARDYKDSSWAQKAGARGK